jgi:hypothetical protein
MIQLNASRRQGGSADYDSDVWGVVELRPGDRLYGGWPGQTEYYTDAETIRAFGSTPVAMWAALQVHANPTYGRRMYIAEYDVLWPVCVPAGRCRNNSSYGTGGGFQYMIVDHDQLLHHTGRILDLHGAHFMV